MSIRGRKLKPGDEATTDYNGKITVVRIMEKMNSRGCQSGILFRVYPQLNNNDAMAWYDADWFSPLDQENLL